MSGRTRLAGAFLAFAGPAFAQAAPPANDLADLATVLGPDWTVVPVQQGAPCSREETYWQCFSKYRPPLPPGADASVMVRITVGADGRVSSCAHNRKGDRAAFGAGACAYTATLRFSPPAIPDTSSYRIYDWGPDDIPPEAMTRPATAAVLIQTGYVRKLPNGQTDPCELLVCASDYPAGSRRRNTEASIIYHVLVTAQGQPKSCWVSMPTSADDLNKATCAVIMARAHFTPARDSSGGDRSSVYSGIMRWTLD